MEQSSAQLNDDVNSPCRDTISTSGVLVRVPLLVARSFEGLSPKLVVGVPRRRRILTGDPDPETASGPVDAFPLQVRRVNRAEPPSHEDEASPHTGTPAQQSCIIDLTVNRLCRIKTIMVLGFWGGWSPIPAEPRVPVSATWVTYICIITDWVVLSTNLDCTYPAAMDWYFRTNWRLVVKDRRPQVRVTGYSILNTLVALGIAVFKYIFREDQPLLNITDVIVGSLIFICLYWLGRMEGNPEGSGAWFFHDDYSPHISSAVWIILLVVKTMFALLSWWWIFFRIVAIVNIIRNRDDPKLTLQFLTLKVGLTVECVLLGWFFLIPVLACLFKWAHWDQGLWYRHHLPPLLAMLAAWVLVVVIGLQRDLPNILFPCSGSTSMVCSVLITYAY